MDFNFGAMLRKFAVGDTSVASGRPIDEIRRDMILNMALYEGAKYGALRRTKIGIYYFYMLN